MYRLSHVDFCGLDSKVDEKCALECYRNVSSHLLNCQQGVLFQNLCAFRRRTLYSALWISMLFQEHFCIFVKCCVGHGVCREQCVLEKTLFLYCTWRMLEFCVLCLKQMWTFQSSIAAFPPVIFDLLNVARCCLLLPTLLNSQAIQSKGLWTRTAGRFVLPVELVSVGAILSFPVLGLMLASCSLTVFALSLAVD